MNKKLVSVKDYKPAPNEVTKNHLLLVTAYIWTLGLEIALSEMKYSSIKGDNIFVKEFKQKTNHFFYFITRKVRKVFGQLLDVDEKSLDVLFDKAVERSKFQVEEFLKDITKVS